LIASLSRLWCGTATRLAGSRSFVYYGMVTGNPPSRLVLLEWRFAWCSTLLARVLQSPPTTPWQRRASSASLEAVRFPVSCSVRARTGFTNVAARHAWWLVADWRPVPTPMGWLRHSSVRPFAVRVVIRSLPGPGFGFFPVKLGVTPAVG